MAIKTNGNEKSKLSNDSCWIETFFLLSDTLSIMHWLNNMSLVVRFSFLISLWWSCTIFTSSVERASLIVRGTGVQRTSIDGHCACTLSTSPLRFLNFKRVLKPLNGRKVRASSAKKRNTQRTKEGTKKVVMYRNISYIIPPSAGFTLLYVVFSFSACFFFFIHLSVLCFLLLSQRAHERTCGIDCVCLWCRTASSSWWWCGGGGGSREDMEVAARCSGMGKLAANIGYILQSWSIKCVSLRNMRTQNALKTCQMPRRIELRLHSEWCSLNNTISLLPFIFMLWLWFSTRCRESL